MRRVLILLLVLACGAQAQSVIPQALKETISLAPRLKRGDAQRFKLTVDYMSLDSLGKPVALKVNELAFTQMCLGNSPDTGLVLESTIDSFVVGEKRSLGNAWRGRTFADRLAGMSFRARYRSAIPVRENCTDLAIPIDTSIRYREAYELVENMMPLRYLEQLRYSAGRRLTTIGDTCTIKFPQPVCYKIKRVVTNFSQDPSPFTLRLSGLTQYAGSPCAIVEFGGIYSPYELGIFSTDTSAFKVQGISRYVGKFFVSLRNGMIIGADFTELVDGLMTTPDKRTGFNRVAKTFKLEPVF